MDLFGWLRNIWKQYQDNKKRQELQDRLDRNAAGRFSKKKYIKDANAVIKAERNKK